MSLQSTTSGVFLLGLLAALALVPAWLQRRDDRTPLLLSLLAAAAAVGLALGEPSGARAAGLSLIVFAAIALTASIGPLERPAARLRGAMSALAVVGGIASFAAPMGLSDGVAGGAAAVLALVVAARIGFVLLRMAREDAAPSRRALLAARACSAGLAAMAVAVGALTAPRSGVFGTMLGAAVALVSSTRLGPRTPPPGREWIAAGFVTAAVGLAVLLEQGPRPAPSAALTAGALVIGVLALSRPLLGAPPRQKERPVATPPRARPGLDAAVLAALRPNYDTGLLRRGGRATVLSRVPARRILEAALERAREAQPGIGREGLAVELRLEDGDADIDCDPTVLADAIAAAIDNAFRLRADFPAMKIRTHVRGGANSVSFEVSDDLRRVTDRELGVADADDPLRSSRAADPVRPGLGLGLARARLLVESQGGALLTRKTAEGSCVQVTMPRRRERPAYALA